MLIMWNANKSLNYINAKWILNAKYYLVIADRAVFFTILYRTMLL